MRDIPHSATESIQIAHAQLVEAYNLQDTAKIGEFYTEDAAVLPSNEVRIDGRVAIQRMWQATVDAGFTDLTITTLEVEANGDWAFEVGTFTMKFPKENEKAAEEIGKYLCIWKKDSKGRWSLYRSVWNGDSPL